MKNLLFILPLLLLTVACTHNVVAPIPGSINQFDSDTYLTLITAKAAIDQAKTDLSAGTFTGAVAAAVKTATNGAITTYNIANNAYMAYHAAALAGQSTAAQQSAVNSAVSNMNTAVLSIATAKGAH